MAAKIITVSNQKGGARKTTTSVNLAAYLAKCGSQVLLIGLDPQGQCATSLGMDPEQGTFYLLMITQSSPHDIIFDTSHSVGGLQERAIWAADLVIIPCATEFASLEAVGNTIVTLQTLKNERNWGGGLRGILPTFYDNKARESRNSLADLKRDFDEKALLPIHAATVLRECWSVGKTIFEYAPESRASQEYETFANLVRKY
jgi:chromosome partitioning protein